MSRLSDYSKFDRLVDSDDDDNKNSAVMSMKQLQQQQSPPEQQQQQHPQLIVDDSESVGTSSTEEEWVFRRRGSHGTQKQQQSSRRFSLEHVPTGRIIYEWEQSLQDVTLYIPTPPNIITNVQQLVCRILPNRLQVGRRFQQSAARPGAGQNSNKQDIDDSSCHYFLNEPTFGTVDVANSTWTWESNVLTIELQKANKGLVWEAACLGNANNCVDTPSSAPTTTPTVMLNPMQLEEEKQRLLLERWQEENPGMDFRNASFNGAIPDPRSFMGGVKYD